MKSFFTLFALLTSVYFSSLAEIAHPSIEIIQPFSRATAGKNGAVFLQIKNNSTMPRTLLKASISPNIAGHCELHTHIKEGDVFRMREVDRMDIPAHETITLKPGGLHIMLMGLKKPLNQSFFMELTLEFDQKERKTILLPIKSAGAKSAQCKCGEK